MAKTQAKKADTEPKFPYTTSPASLRRLLQEIPKRPKPGKLTIEAMKTWGVTTSNDGSPLRVLKMLGLLSSAGEPLPPYSEYMQTPPAGPQALGARVKDVYGRLFETSHEPHKQGEELRTFFNINSGGGERALEYQVQTFKALSEFADFSASGGPNGSGVGSGAAGTGAGAGGSGNSGEGGAGLPPVRVDLHIHLPENKSTRDYEAIIQDIARYIYGRNLDRG